MTGEELIKKIQELGPEKKIEMYILRSFMDIRELRSFERSDDDKTGTIILKPDYYNFM